MNVETYVDELRLLEDSGPTRVQALVLGLLVLVVGEIGRLMQIASAVTASYFRGFAVASRLLGFPLHVFSLNYDCGVEMNSGADFHVETGFAKRDGKHRWDGSRFTNLPNHRGRGVPSVNLAKFHGSVDWQLDDSGGLVSVDISQGIDMSRAVLVLGHRDKAGRRFPPPYERYKEMFRERCLVSPQIVVIGYGFAGEEINELLEDAMMNENIEEVLVVGKFGDGIEQAREEIGILLGGGEKLRLVESSAKDFLESLGDNLEIVAPGVGRVRV